VSWLEKRSQERGRSLDQVAAAVVLTHNARIAPEDF